MRPWREERGSADRGRKGRVVLPKRRIGDCPQVLHQPLTGSLEEFRPAARGSPAGWRRQSKGGRLTSMML